MSNDYRKAAWAITSDPFYPDRLADGSSIQQDAWETDLKPSIDRTVLQLFFDVYDFSHSPLISGLSKTDGLAGFPTRRSLPSNAPMFVIISGPSHSGLDSLANLVSYKIAEDEPALLIESRFRMEGRDPQQNLSRIATSLIDDIEYNVNISDSKTYAKHMKERWKRAAKDEEGRSDSLYSDVFRAYARILAPARMRLIIRILDGGDHDSWAQLYKAARDLVAGVIITTADASYAKTCFEAMSADKQNVTWIRALPLTLEKTHDFVQERLAVVRIPGDGHNSSNMHPFTKGAIDVLFEHGSRSKGDEVLSHPVGWVRQTLHHALEDALRSAKAAVPSGDIDTLATHSSYPFLVDAQCVIAARNRLNRGSRL